MGEEPERVLGWRPAGRHSARVHVLPSLLPGMGGANGFHLDRHTAGECGNTASKGRPVTDPKVRGTGRTEAQAGTNRLIFGKIQDLIISHSVDFLWGPDS